MFAGLRALHPLELRLPTPLHELEDDRLERVGIRVLLKRDDLIHPEFPGNKWRKLKYNLTAATEAGARTLLTFGGAYSNHIQATAAAGYYFGFSTIGIIRGEEHLPLNPVLSASVEHGMRLSYVDRSQYRRKTDPDFLAVLRDQFGDFFMIPEGGGNCHALRGCAEIPAEIDTEYDVICCASGTGTTLAGLASALRSPTQAVGFSSLKGGEFLVEDIGRLQANCGRVSNNWSIETGYHFGGFARRNAVLDKFVDDFASRHGITLDWVYEAKMMHGLFDLVSLGRFRRGTVIVALLA